MDQTMTDFRKQVREKIRKRGRCRYNVWIGPASKGGYEFALNGTPSTLHLIWMEADPDVVGYSFPTKKSDTSESSTTPDVICLLRSGQIEWRTICDDSSPENQRSQQEALILQQKSGVGKFSVDCRIITLAEINKHATLITNWRKGLTYLRCVADFDLSRFERDIMFLLGTHKPLTILQLDNAYPLSGETFLVAAIFKLAQRGAIDTDLADKPLSGNTIIWRRVP